VTTPAGAQAPGYSKPLVAKLGIKASHRLRIEGAPRGFTKLLGPLPAGAVIVSPTAMVADCVLLFASSASDLASAFPRAAASLPPAGMLWVAWPKKASKMPTDLSGDVVRTIGLTHGLVDIKVCAITDVWSGLKFVRRLRDR
jgi:hypothetical protein